MWGMSWANLLMLTASIPDFEDDDDNENEIDALNWQQYVSK